MPRPTLPQAIRRLWRCGKFHLNTWRYENAKHTLCSNDKLKLSITCTGRVSFVYAFPLTPACFARLNAMIRTTHSLGKLQSESETVILSRSDPCTGYRWRLLPKMASGEHYPRNGGEFLSSFGRKARQRELSLCWLGGVRQVQRIINVIPT